MNITNDTEKIKIVERLVKEGAIDFLEALKLLEEPYQQQVQWPDYPIYPNWPNNPTFLTNNEFQISENLTDIVIDFSRMSGTN